MPRHCSAAGCKSRDTRETRKAGITFHRLPKRGSPRRTQWIINSQRKDPQGKGHWDPQSHFIYFCSKHFTPESFELTGVSGYRRLKDDALPTVFETFSRQRRGTSEKRQRASKQVDTTRQTWRQTRSLKYRSTGLESDGQQGSENCTGARTAADNSDFQMGDNAEENSDAKAAGRVEQGESPPCPASTFLSDSHPLPLTSHDLRPQSEAVLSPSQTTLPFPTSSESTSPPQPPSPSRYMKRLPPPPGFHLPREHSYAQLCPLVWRKRYDRAIDSLEKTLRLLNAARRRETRLRHTLLRLRDDHLRQTLQHLRGTKSKEARSRAKKCLQDVDGETAVRQGADEQEIEVVRVAEEIKLICDDTEDYSEWGQYSQSSAGVEEMGYCFYCGRGQDEFGGIEERNLGEPQRIKEREEAKPGSHFQGTSEREDLRRAGTNQMDGNTQEKVADLETEACCYYYYSGNMAGQEDEEGEGVQILTMTLPQGWNVSPEQQEMASLQRQSNVPNMLEGTGMLQEPQSVQLQLQAEQLDKSALTTSRTAGALQAEQLDKSALTTSRTAGALQAVPLPQGLDLRVQPVSLEVHKPLLHLQQAQLIEQSLAPQRVFVMDSARDGEVGAGEEERHVFWLQEDRDGQLLLVPVAQEDVEKPTVSNEQRQTGIQQVLVSGVGLHNNHSEDTKGLCVTTDYGGDVIRGQREKNNGHPVEVRTVAAGGDLREKLKEHLEGFQLQLSSEFIN